MRKVNAKNQVPANAIAHLPRYIYTQFNRKSECQCVKDEEGAVDPSACERDVCLAFDSDAGGVSGLLCVAGRRRRRRRRRRRLRREKEGSFNHILQQEEERRGEGRGRGGGGGGRSCCLRM
jgi:hypothetical protein